MHNRTVLGDAYKRAVRRPLTHDTPTIHCSNRSIISFIDYISMQMSMHSGITSYPTRITSYPTVFSAYRILSQ